MRKKKDKVENVVLLPKKLIRYHEIVADEERKKTYRSFGVCSVFESLAAVIFSMAIFAATYVSISNIVLFIVVEIVLYTLATAVPLVALFHALFDLILQFRLNRQSITITALMFFIAAVIGVVFIILGGLGTLK